MALISSWEKKQVGKAGFFGYNEEEAVGDVLRHTEAECCILRESNLMTGLVGLLPSRFFY